MANNSYATATASSMFAAFKEAYRRTPRCFFGLCRDYRYCLDCERFPEDLTKFEAAVLGLEKRNGKWQLSTK
jgi:hypothetical protein